MRKLRQWLYDHFLEAATKQLLYAELEANRETIRELKQSIREQDALIEGLRYGMRSLRKININVREVEQ